MPPLALALAFALLAAAAPAPAADLGLVRELTLEEADRTALLNNAALLSAEQDIVIARQRVQEARFQFFPEIGLQASASRYDARYPMALAPDFRSVLLFPSDYDGIYSGRAYLRQPVYEGGRHMNVLRLAHASLKQAQTQYETAKLDAAFNTRKVFYRLMLAQEVQAAVAERLEQARQLLADGLAGWERVEAEALASELRSREGAARRSVEAARLELLKDLNLELDTPLKVVGGLDTKPIDIDIERAILWATELRPELQAETYRAQMDAIGVNLALGRRNPTLVIGADYEVTGQRFPIRQNNWDLTVGLKIPFSYDFWSQIKQKRAEQRQGDIKRAEIHDRVRLEVRQAYGDVAYWQSEWPLREDEYSRLKTLSLAALKGSPPGALKGSPPGASQGQPSGLPALRAQVGVLGAQERWLGSVQEHILARARLERAVGRTLGR